MINWILISLIISIILIGFFAGIQVAFVSINRLNVELKKKQGSAGGALLSHFFAEPSKFIGVTLVGVNVFLVIYGLLVGELLTPLWNWVIVYLKVPEGSVNIVKLIF